MAVRVADTIEPMGDGSYPVVAATNVSGLATVATTGDYNDLINTPGGGDNAEYAQKIGTSQSHPAIGSTSLPVYVNNNGEIKAISSLEFNGSSVLPKGKTTNYQSFSLNTGSIEWETDGSTLCTAFGLSGCWLANNPIYAHGQETAMIEDTWTIDIGGTLYRAGNITTNVDIAPYCPNVTSDSSLLSTIVPLINNSTSEPFIGAVLVAVGPTVIPDASNYYFLIVDKTLYPGESYPSTFYNAYVSYQYVTGETNASISTDDLTALESFNTKTATISSNASIGNTLSVGQTIINHSTYISQGEKYRKTTSVNLQTFSSWSTYKSCWECGYPNPLATYDTWSQDNKGEFYLAGLANQFGDYWYYADPADAQYGVDLQTFCPNAQSYSLDMAFPVKYYDPNTGSLVSVSGMCISYANSQYIFWIDNVLFAGSGDRPDFIASDTADFYGYYTTNGDVGSISTNELSTTNLQITKRISNSYLSTYPYGTKYEPQQSIQYKSELTYYSSWSCYRTASLNTTYGFSITKGVPLRISINEQSYDGTWYNANEGPGYADTGYTTTGKEYCYFTNECCLVMTATTTPRILASSNLYNNSILDSDIFSTLTQIDTTDGVTEVNGVLRVTGSDSYEKGTIYCSKIVKYERWENPNMSIEANLQLPFNSDSSPDLSSYWSGSSLYICDYELDILPFEYVSVSWNSTDEPDKYITINPEDWWVDSSNNAYGFNIFNNTGSDPQPISVWYDTSVRKFKMWENAQTGNAAPTSMYVYYGKSSGMEARSVVLSNSSGNMSTARTTISTPASTVMTDQASSLILQPQKIQIGNPGDSTGTTVTINRNSITIGNTTINEAQLQALLALISNPPASATLGVMSIVE